MKPITNKKSPTSSGKVGCLTIVILLALFVGCTALFYKPKTEAEQLQDWYDSGAFFYSCENVLKKQLRDPDSYKSDADYTTSADTGKQKFIAWKFRAKNGFGGYNESIASCKVSKEGQGSVSVKILGQ